MNANLKKYNKRCNTSIPYSMITIVDKKDKKHPFFLKHLGLSAAWRKGGMQICEEASPFLHRSLIAFAFTSWFKWLIHHKEQYVGGAFVQTSNYQILPYFPKRIQGRAMPPWELVTGLTYFIVHLKIYSSLTQSSHWRHLTFMSLLSLQI